MNRLIFVILLICSFFKGFGQTIPYVNFDITPYKATKHKIKKVKCYSDSNLVKVLSFMPNGLLKDSIIGYNIEKNDLEFSITNMNYSRSKKLLSYKYTLYFQNNFRCNQFLRRHENKSNIIKTLKHEKKLNLSVRILSDKNKTLQIYELKDKVIDTIIVLEQNLYAEYILKSILKINQYGEINTNIDSLVENLENVKVTIDTMIKNKNHIYTYYFDRNDVNNIDTEIYKIIDKEKKFVLEHSFDDLQLLYMYYQFSENQLNISNIIQYDKSSGINNIVSQHQFLYSSEGILDKIIYDRTSGLFPSEITLTKDGKLFRIENSSQNRKGEIERSYSEYYYYSNKLPKKMVSFKNGIKTEEYLLIYDFYN